MYGIVTYTANISECNIFYNPVYRFETFSIFSSIAVCKKEKPSEAILASEGFYIIFMFEKKLKIRPPKAAF